MRSGQIFSVSLLLGTISATTLAAPVGAQTVEALRQVAYGAEFSDELDIAEDMWSQLTQLTPDIAANYSQLGYVQLQQEKWAAAEAAFTQGIALMDPSQDLDPSAFYLGLGSALRAQGKFADAKAALQTAVTLDDHSPFSYRALGRLHRDYGELEAAVAAFNAILQLEPVGSNGAEAYWDLGKTLMAKGDLSEAELAYRRAIGLDSEDVRFWQSLATVLNQQGGSSELANIANNINRLDEDEAVEPTGLSAAFSSLAGRYGISAARTRAISAQQVLDRYPEILTVYIELGSALRKIGQFAAAEAALQQAIALNPDNPLAQYRLSEILNDLGRSAEADAAYQIAQRLYPDIASPRTPSHVLAPLSSIYQFSGPIGAQYPTVAEQPQALAMTANANAGEVMVTALPRQRLPSRLTSTRVPILPPSLRAPTRVTLLPATRRSPSSEPAPDPLLERIRLNPDDAILQGQLGDRFYRQDDFDAAAEAFRTMAELDPRYAHLAYHNLAVTFRQQTQLAQSKRLLYQAIEVANQLTEDTLSSEETQRQIALTYQVLGDLLIEQEAWTEVVALFQSAVERSLPLPGNRRLSSYQYNSYYWDAKRREALLFLARYSFAQADMDSAEAAYKALILAYSENGNIVTAQYSLPRHQVVDELATLLFVQGKLQEAELIYVDSMRRVPTDARQLYRGLETVLRAQNRTQDADSLVAAFQSVATANVLPSPTAILSQRTIVTRRLPASAQTFSVGLSATPSVRPDGRTSVSPLSQAYYDFGQSRLIEGRYSYAAFAFESALINSRATATYLDALVAAGSVARYEGNQTRANDLYGRAIAADPDSIKCYIVPPELADSPWQPEDYLQTGNDCLPLLID
ncbi:MAG: tetratricopeptide repeat protein [Cyanobacteria bacterium J06607_10]